MRDREHNRQKSHYHDVAPLTWASPTIQPFKSSPLKWKTDFCVLQMFF